MKTVLKGLHGAMNTLVLGWHKCPTESIKISKKVPTVPNYGSWHFNIVNNIYKSAIKYKKYQICTFALNRPTVDTYIPYCTIDAQN